MKKAMKVILECLGKRMRYFFYVALPWMFLGFIFFSLALYFLGLYLIKTGEIVDGSIPVEGTATFYVCQTPEDCEGIRSGD